MDEDPRYLECVSASLQGRRRTMDSSSVGLVSPAQESSSARRPRGPTGIYGVFDGSSGSLAAYHCQNTLVNVLKETPSYNTDIEKALAVACATLHKSVREVISSTHSSSTAGAAVVCIRDGHLYAVEASRKSKQTRSMLMRADREIVWLDGSTPPPTSDLSPNASKTSTLRRNADLGVETDPEDPESGIQVMVLGLDYEDEFVIMASAGLWSVISGTTAAQLVKSEMQKHGNLSRAAQKLVYAAFVNGSALNIVVQIVLLNSTATATPPSSGRKFASDRSDRQRTGFLRLINPQVSNDWDEDSNDVENAGTSSRKFMRFGKAGKDATLTPGGRRPAPAVYGPGKKTTRPHVRVTDSPRVVMAQATKPMTPLQKAGSKASSQNLKVDKSPSTSFTKSPKVHFESPPKPTPKDLLPSSSTVTDQYDDRDLDGLSEPSPTSAGTPSWWKTPRNAVGEEQQNSKQSTGVDERSKFHEADIPGTLPVRLNFTDIRKASNSGTPRPSGKSCASPPEPEPPLSPEVRVPKTDREGALMALSTDELGLLMENYAKTYQYEEAARIRNVIVRKTESDSKAEEVL